ncbi:4'-phosphopantetheinyl transferase family protein [Actinoplanes solisilvae]|uniref:4'-phosphopantetheinyl transferase family protein n=1 Tax=Actinoplanes solisilvae TaxID=2486853 RepID=UPI000FD8EB72|nr:4'-phosphopantetheinyl transferase superfamily protein [Actinoplanes solisilvae]
MLEKIVPAAAVAAEAFEDAPDEQPHPGEEHLITRAVDGRRREFMTTRRCARVALARLGVPAVPILTGPNREPLWPNGIVGSLTHCTGYRAAVVARATDLASIGIDAEPHAPLPPDVLRLVTSPAERDHLAELTTADPTVHWDRLLFSAKESIYKAWHPLTARWLGFDEAELTIDPTTQTFTARLLVTDPIPMNGRYLVERNLVVTAVSVPLDAEPLHR